MPLQSSRSKMEPFVRVTGGGNSEADRAAKDYQLKCHAIDEIMETVMCRYRRYGQLVQLICDLQVRILKEVMISKGIGTDGGTWRM